MEIQSLLLLLSMIGLAGGALLVLLVAIRSGQFKDTEAVKHRILED